MPIPIDLLLIPLLGLGLGFFLRSRTQAASDGVPLSQINLIPERWSDPFRPLGIRRMLVVVWAMTLGLGLIAAVQTWTYAPFVMIAAWCLGLLLSQTTRLMAESSADMLDERMLAARNQSFRWAYYGLGSSLVAVALIASQFDEVTLTKLSLVFGAFAIVIIVAYLPAALLAWTEDVI